MLKMFSLENRNAIVIGGTKGIGRGIAHGLSMAGANLVIVSRHQGDCENIAKELELESGNRAIGIAADVTDKNSLEKLITSVSSIYGQIDILVNSAGTNVRKDTIDFTEDDWDKVQNVQLKGSFLACQAVGRHMIDKGIKGKIINISSIDSIVVSRPNIISYMAAKGAVSQMTKALAVEWADKGICVNAIAPGYFETEMTKVLFKDEKIKNELFSNIPQKRFGKIYDDLAGLAVYFSSDASSYTTGQIVYVDGGYTLI